MATASSNLENEVKSWLKQVLKVDSSSDLSINILGNSEKGDGYMGDIVFVIARNLTKHGYTEEYNLVLKCSKRSQVLRETWSVNEVFLNEIFIYEKLLPYYIQYQNEKGVEHPFDSAPKYYGSYKGDNIEVIVLENLKCSGYELWPKKQPLSRKHVDLITKEYAKFHATSVALKEQQPTEFQKLVDSLSHVYEESAKRAKPNDMELLFTKPIDDAYDLLKNDLDNESLLKWRGLKDQINYIMKDMLQVQNQTGLKVILHGDCWNNNFMFLHDKTEHTTPLKVAFLDWQVARYLSPVLDLSYFLFSCVSAEDLKQLEVIKLAYYTSFVEHLGQLGVNQPEDLYSYDQFLNDWKSYSRFGILMTSLLMKIVSSNKDEVVDLADVVESGQHFSETFITDISDTENYKKRIRPIVEYVVKHDLI